MPHPLKKILSILTLSSLLVLIPDTYLPAKGSQGITTYYIRLDINSSAHRITNSKLTMIPAENDYRQENFARFSVSHLVKASPQESNQTLENLAKKNAFMRVLEHHGLKSMTNLNHETILSYEGMIQTPVSLKIGPYDYALGAFPYMAGIHFAPLAFPDQWKSLKDQFKIKEIIDDFILLFK